MMCDFWHSPVPSLGGGGYAGCYSNLHFHEAQTQFSCLFKIVKVYNRLRSCPLRDRPQVALCMRLVIGFYIFHKINIYFVFVVLLERPITRWHRLAPNPSPEHFFNNLLGSILGCVHVRISNVIDDKARTLSNVKKVHAKIVYTIVARAAAFLRISYASAAQSNFFPSLLGAISVEILTIALFLKKALLRISNKKVTKSSEKRRFLCKNM